MAHFEVYILNYNGERYLSTCLNALRTVERGEHALSVNVVDNGSSDNSEALVKRDFPEVNFIALGQNHGFSRGNNLGVRIRQQQLRKQGKIADFHVFLNNDTAVEANWLTAVFEASQRHPKGGLFGSKSVFFDRYVALELRCRAPFSPAQYGDGDSRTLGVFLRDEVKGENIHPDRRRTKFQGEFPLEAEGRWLGGSAQIMLAVQDPMALLRWNATLENRHPEKEKMEVDLYLNGASEPFKTVTIRQGEPRRLTLSFSPENFVDIIQNAGSFVTKDWQAGDRGLYDVDLGQFDTEEQVDALCGVSLFITEKAFNRLRGFDESFFAYYEDTDLSLRAKIAGFECWFVPTSVLRHIHCGSGGGEYSNYFNAQVAISHLIFGSKMMSRADWSAKLHSVRSLGQEQFERFLLDGALDNKPQLRALGRFKRKRHIFVFNRIFATFYQPERTLAPYFKGSRK